MASQMWLVTVPNNRNDSSKTLAKVQSGIPASYGKIYEVKMPNLVVGTLDTLMALADDLHKIGSQVENVVRKVERQYNEIAGSNAEALRVNETSVEAYLQSFAWDHAQYQHQGRQLIELVGQIQSMAGKIDEDLKVVSTTYTDKSLALATTRRKKVINLAQSDLEDFLTEQEFSSLEILDSDNLLSVFVIVPAAAEDDFLKNYADIGTTIAAFGGPDWSSSSGVGRNDGQFGSAIQRDAVTGSPVVPDSAIKVKAEGDQVMYMLTILKGQYQAGLIVDDVFSPGEFVDYVESTRQAFREKKYVMRDATAFDARKAGGVDAAIVQGEEEMKQVTSKSMRWCHAHFGEAYNGWMHLKVIQAFVESVLRYGLPVDFLTFLLEPNMRFEKDLGLRLTKSVLDICPELQMKRLLIDEDDEESENTENLPYMCLKFPVVGSSAGSS